MCELGVRCRFIAMAWEVKSGLEADGRLSKLALAARGAMKAWW